MKYIKIILIIICTVMVIKILIQQLQSYFLFRPIKTDQHYDRDLLYHQKRISFQLKTPITIKEFNITTSEGEVINGIHLHNSSSPNCVMFSHGNAGHIYNRFHYLEMFAPLGSFVMYDYRGYGKSSGTPCIAGILSDSYEVWKHFSKEHYAPEQITLFGESLGSAVTSWLGSRLVADHAKKPAGIVLLAGFSSLMQIAADNYGKIFTYFLDDELNSAKYLKQIGDRIPIIIYHSRDDELIDYSHKDILMAHNSSAEHHEISGGHSTPLLDHAFLKLFSKYLYKDDYMTLAQVV